MRSDGQVKTYLKIDVRKRILPAFAVIILMGSSASAQQCGGFVSFQPREIVPGAYMEFPPGRLVYRRSLGVPVMLDDIHDGGKPNLSAWSAHMEGIIGIEYLTAGDFDIQDKTVSDEFEVRFAPFMGWYTALFEMRGLQWLRFAPYAGVSCLKIFGPREKGKKRWGPIPASV